MLFIFLGDPKEFQVAVGNENYCGEFRRVCPYDVKKGTGIILAVSFTINTKY